MKKICKLLTVLIVVLSIFTLAVPAIFAENTDKVIVTNSEFEAEQGGVFSTTFSISSTKDVEAFEASLVYDADIVELTNTSVYHIGGQNALFSDNDTDYVVHSYNEDGNAKFIFFEVIGECSAADIACVNAENYETEYSDKFALVKENYDVAMTAFRASYGIIACINDVLINAVNNKILISWSPENPDVNGSDVFMLQFVAEENLAEKDYNEWIKVDPDYESFALYGDDYLPLSFEFSPLSIHGFGDVNYDHKINTVDALRARQHFLEVEGRILTGLKLKLGDVNFDNKVNTRDALSIQKYIIKLTDKIGNRYNVKFHDINGNVCYVKSVVVGNGVVKMPVVPEADGYSDGKWSMSKEEYIEPDLSNIQSDVNVYSIYTKNDSEAMLYYKERLTNMYYRENTLHSNLSLISELTFQDEFTAKIYWSSSNGATLNATTGEFSRPTYDSTVDLTAEIVSYAGTTIEAISEITFSYTVDGVFSTPTKGEIDNYLRKLVGTKIDYNMNLPQKVSNSDVKSSNPYEVRVEWVVKEDDNSETGISQIIRNTTTQNVNLIAKVTFNGKPLEDDGRIYFDNIELSAITEDEVKYHIINQVAANMGLTITNGESLWNDDQVYNATVKWISKNKDIAVIENNQITISDTAVNGESLPIEAQITYVTDSGTNTFNLSYTISVYTTNSVLVPGTNIDPSLYDALRDALNINGGLTTEALKKTSFVYLDLSGYPEITDLTGLTYCENLRVLNISGLNIERGMNEISNLSKLEALIARNCGLSSLTDGGVPVLKNMINIKLVDLAHNNFKTLDSVFAEGVIYGKLSEVYLDNNQLDDISNLSAAPILGVLTLSNNGLTSGDLASLSEFKFLTYLSLADNEIDSISHIKNLRSLVELRLQNNNIRNLYDLRLLINLKALYLGGNNISNVYTAGGTETNVSMLANLSELKVLYLNNNNIEDISDLSGLNNLVSINVSNNAIQDLSVLDDLGETMEEVYAENNLIESVAFARNLSKLRKLMLSGNARTYEANLPTYLAGLTSLETLTLSGKELRTLSFLDGMTKLIRLDIEDCGLDAYTVSNSSVITNENGKTTIEISSYEDNISPILGLSATLKFLNIANNGFSYHTDILGKYDNFSFPNGTPTDFSALYELGNLVAFYADNLDFDVDAASLLNIMTKLKYISLENCGITDASWLYKYRNLIYLNLAGNKISHFDLGTYISERSKNSLQYLYVDTTVDCEFVDSWKSYDNNVLKELSISGMALPELDYLPNMPNLTYLNISNTGVASLNGSSADFTDMYGIERFAKLETIDVSGNDLSIEPLKSLPELKTVYAVGAADSKLFYKVSIDTLYTLYNSGVKCYLYDKNVEYEPVAKTEGDIILGEIEDISSDIIVAANNVISDNNPVLVDTVNGYAINWTLSNNINYEIIDGKISVKDYTNIDDETLTVTASIDVYPNQSAVTREFTINVDILRASAEYVNIDSTGVSDYLTLGEDFTYDVDVIAAETEGFSEAVMPVAYDTVAYKYTANGENGTTIIPSTVIIVGEDNNFTVNSEAAFGAYFTITAEVGHYINNEFIVDYAVTSRKMTISSRTFTVNYVTNGGTVKSNSDGALVTSEKYAERSVLFENVTVERKGYIFNGWYLDSDFQTEFTETTMPSNDITLYAKWTAHSYTVYFNANGGAVSETERLALCDVAIGTLPVPTRDYYTFKGWYTASEGGNKVTDDTSYTTTNDITLYARWELNPLSGWVLESDVPAGTQVVNQKWSYDLTTNIESDKSSVDGYTLYKTTSVWGEYGTWSSWSKTAVSQSDSRQIETKTVTDKAAYTQYRYKRYHLDGGNRIHWCPTLGKNYYGGTWSAQYTDWMNSPYSNNGYAGKCSCHGSVNSYGGNNGTNVYYYQETRTIAAVTHTEYRYRDRELIYTYYLTKTEAKESTTQVTASSTISNVKKWVQYRAK